MVEIIPSILTNDPAELLSLLALSEGKVERVQIDIIDGKFANNKTIDPSLLESAETNLNIDFHLMTKDPIDWVERSKRAGADRIIGQIEMMSDQIEFVSKVQSVGSKVGLAVDLDTDISEIDPSIIKDLDVVLLMSVKAGFGGQTFSELVFDKIKKLNNVREGDETPFKICIDGGVTKEIIVKLEELGVDEVSIGKRFFEGKI